MRRPVHRSLALASTLVVAACGVVIYDTSSRVLILEPVSHVEFASDHGGVEVYAFDRTAISLFYALTGFETSIADVGHRLDDDTLAAFIACEGDDLCNANFYCEVPLGTTLDVTARSGDVKLTGVDAEVNATVEAGNFDGVGLDGGALVLDVISGDVAIAWDTPPVSAEITVESGNVTLTLPAGTYRCELAAADGVVDDAGVTCDPTAATALTVRVETGDIVLRSAT